MSGILVEHDPENVRPHELGGLDWSETSGFPWTYDAEETCYFLEGDVTVTPDGGEPARMGKGDIVTFPKGRSCRWHIHQDVRTHYTFRQEAGYFSEKLYIFCYDVYV